MIENISGAYAFHIDMLHYNVSLSLSIYFVLARTTSLNYLAFNNRFVADGVFFFKLEHDTKIQLKLKESIDMAQNSMYNMWIYWQWKNDFHVQWWWHVSMRLRTLSICGLDYFAHLSRFATHTHK